MSCFKSISSDGPFADFKKKYSLNIAAKITYTRFTSGFMLLCLQLMYNDSAIDKLLLNYSTINAIMCRSGEENLQGDTACGWEIGLWETSNKLRFAHSKAVTTRSYSQV